jgi:hypothetical protein
MTNSFLKFGQTLYMLGLSKNEYSALWKRCVNNFFFVRTDASSEQGGSGWASKERLAVSRPVPFGFMLIAACFELSAVQ